VSDPGTVVIARHWSRRQSELAFVARSIAGAASRLGPVSVLVPSPLGTREPDGAFDLLGMDDRGAYGWPAGVPTGATIVVDDPTPEIGTLVSRADPRACFTLSPTQGADPVWPPIPLVPGGDRPFVGSHVPVHPMAATQRHGGFGFTGYLLVLSDRADRSEDPPAAAAWLTAAFPDLHVVVVEGAAASAWKGRSLRGSTHVDTRMDLWRLAAHARVCIDLAPGRHLARECVEALRFGTPIMVPSNAGAGAVHAVASGGSTFGDAGDLVREAAAFLDDTSRVRASDLATRYADSHYGDPGTLVVRLGTLFAGT
jgi:hypothetical protein